MTKLVRVALASALAASVAAPSVASAAEKLIITTNVPTQHWASTQGAEPFMACVKQTTNGAIDFSYFPGGQLQNFNNSLDVVQTGLAQISYLVISALSSKMPLNGIPMLPDMGNSVVEMTNANRKAIDTIPALRKEFTDNKVRPLLINMFPAYQLVMKAGPLDNPKDVAGRKVSTGGSTMTFAVKAMGGNPVELPAADNYMAIQQGTVDGVLLGLASVKPYNLQEVAKAVTTNANFGSASGIWAMDEATWGKLPADQQKAFVDCGLKVEGEIAKWVDDYTVKLQAELATAGVKLYTLTPDAQKAFGEKVKDASNEYVDRLAKRGMPSKEVYDAYLKILGR